MRDATAPRERPGPFLPWSCLLWLLFPVAALADPAFVYESSLIGDPPLVRPISATLDPVTLEICITDEGSGTLNVFDDSGLHRFRTDATSALGIPHSGSLDSEGGFVFIDVVDGSRRIRRLNFLGEPRAYDAEVPQDDWAPRHLIITSDGHFVTLDRSALLVKHDGTDGTLLWKQQLRITTEDRSDLLGRPAEAPNGSIYIPNPSEGYINVVSAEGLSLGTFAERGVRPGMLSFPVGLTFAPGGFVVVLDRMKHKVIIFDPEHEFVAEFGSVGARPGDFYNPVAIAATLDGRVLVTQGFEGRVQVYRLSGLVSDEGSVEDPGAPSSP